MRAAHYGRASNENSRAVRTHRLGLRNNSEEPCPAGNGEVSRVLRPHLRPGRSQSDALAGFQCRQNEGRRHRNGLRRKLDVVQQKRLVIHMWPISKNGETELLGLTCPLADICPVERIVATASKDGQR